MTRRKTTDDQEEDNLLLLVPIHADPHPLLYVGGSHTVRQIHHELGELLHIDDILGVVRVCIDNLGAAGDLGEENVEM